MSFPLSPALSPFVPHGERGLARRDVARASWESAGFAPLSHTLSNRAVSGHFRQRALPKNFVLRPNMPELACHGRCVSELLGLPEGCRHYPHAAIVESASPPSGGGPEAYGTSSPSDSAELSRHCDVTALNRPWDRAGRILKIPPSGGWKAARTCTLESVRYT